MSGGYTHITLAQLAIEKARNRREGLLHSDCQASLGKLEKVLHRRGGSPRLPVSRRTGQ